MGKAVASARRQRELNEWAYKGIRSLIFEAKLLPGQKLLHHDLSRRLNVSMTPVREALSRLTQDGLVDKLNGRGHFVRAISHQEVEDLFEMREALECFVAEKLAGQSESIFVLKKLEKQQEQFLKAIRKGDVNTRLRCDRGFHVILGGSVGNVQIENQIVRFFERIHLKRKIEGLSQTRGEEAYKEHQNVIEAIRKKKPSEAREKMRIHIQKNFQNFVNQLQVQRVLRTI